MENFKYTDREKQYFNKSLGNSDNREVFAEVVVYPHQDVDKALVAKHLNKDLKEASWHKVSFDDEKIVIRFDAYLPFLDKKHDDSEVIFNLVEDAYANCDYDITQSELMAKIFRMWFSGMVYQIFPSISQPYTKKILWLVSKNCTVEVSGPIVRRTTIRLILMNTTMIITTMIEW